MGCYLHQRVAFRRASRELLAEINGFGIGPLQELGRFQRGSAVSEDSGSGQLIVSLSPTDAQGRGIIGDAAGAAVGAAHEQLA